MLTKKEEEAAEMRFALTQALDAIEAEERIVTEDEVSEAIAEAIRMQFELMKMNSNKPHTCPQCGAPLHNGKCDYCGTEY